MILLCILVVALLHEQETLAWMPGSGIMRQKVNSLASSSSSKDHFPSKEDCPDRRDVLKYVAKSACAVAAAATTTGTTMMMPSLFLPAPANAMDLYTKRSKDYAYSFQPPEGFKEGNKPLKTHLDEVNFFKDSDALPSGYQFGITVDPVRIPSLEAFGTPEEVAAKVVLAEVNRDGIFDVTLMKDPIKGKQQQQPAASGSSTNEDDAAAAISPYYYQLDYLSQGKRGDKRFIAKFFIQNQHLYAMTAQCKEVDYKTVQNQLLKAVESFQVLPKAG